MMVSPFAEFISIGPRTSLYTPPKSAAGELVVICTWLGAAAKHILKYIALYQMIAPRARILLIQSAIPILISKYERQRKAIKPAILAIMDVLNECYYEPLSQSGDERRPLQDDTTKSASSAKASVKTAPKILLHMFSNGGTNTATQLLIVFQERMEAPLPVVGLVFDSCPAKGTYWKSYSAMVLSLPKSPVGNFLRPLIVHFILLVLYSWIGMGNENPASLMRRTLLDKNKLQDVRSMSGDQTAKGRVGRAFYIYSKADEMVDWTDIRDHAEEARQKGWLVEEVVFDGSGHCAHFSKDEETYSKVVDTAYSDAVISERR